MERIASRKILFVITKSNWGGAQQYVYTLATRFREAGADVVVAYGGTGSRGAAPGLLAERLRDANIRTHFLSSFMRNVGIFREFAAFMELLQLIRRERPDVLHLNSSKAGGIGALAGRLTHVSMIVFTAHGWAHHEIRPLYQRVLIWGASWLTAVLCHRIIVLSHYHFRHAPMLFSRKKIVIVHNGMAPFHILPRDQAREALVARCGGLAQHRTGAAIWVMTIAELTHNKGIDTLISAFSAVVKQYPHVVLIIIGGGELRMELVERVRNLGLESHIFFADFISDARSYLDAADIFVLPSRKEGLPLVILEAGLAERPTIATRVGAIPEVIEDGQSGLLVAEDNVSGLRDAILHYCNDPIERARMGRTLHARIIRDFSEETMLKRTAIVYYRS